MGRYYSGDIEGKFWFAIQSSEDATFFGVEPNEPNEIEYTFEKEDLSSIKKGIKTCKEKLGEYEKKLNKFFKKRSSYNNKMIAKDFEIKEDKVVMLLEWYARLELGKKILKEVEKTGSCYFTAELD